MPDDRSEIVEIFDESAGPDPGQAGAQPDAIRQGQARAPLLIMDRWPWWRRTNAVSRVLTVIGAAAFVVAAIAGYGALAAHPGTQYFVNQDLHPAAPVTVDAVGCPAAVTCALVDVPGPILAAVRHVVPSARVTYARQSVDPRSGQVFRREIDLSARQTTMRIVSACVPGAGPVPAQAMTLTVYTGTGPRVAIQDDPTGRRGLTQIVPGAVGCSLSTEADTTLPDGRLDHRSVRGLLARLAADPALMVTR